MTKRVLPLLLLALACTHQRSGGNIVFGAAGPWNEAYGDMNHKGIELALDEINARQEWRAHPLRVDFANDSGKGAVAAAAASAFVDNDSIVAVVGHVSSGAMVAAARVYDGHLPAVATTACSPALTGISRWTFRAISSDSINGETIARFEMTRGKMRAAVLYENSAYGRGLADAFRRAYRGNIVSMDPMGDGEHVDVEPFVTYYKRMHPDVVFVAGTGESGIGFLREAQRQGLTAELVGGDGWSVISSDTALAEGIFVGAPFSADDPRPEARRFVDAFRQRFGATPDGNAALAYDATMLLADAVQKVGPDRSRIRDYLAEMRDPFKGVTGDIRFGAGGDPEGKSIVMTRVHRGALIVESN